MNTKKIYKKHVVRKIVAGLFFCQLLGAGSTLAVPGSMNFQGALTNADGTRLSDGAYNISFVLYDTATAGTAKWTESHAGVTVEHGVFSVELGSSTAIDSADLDSDTYLGITVNGGTEMTPRQQLLSVAYSFKAQDADTLDGMTAAEFAASEHNHDEEYAASGHEHDAAYVNEGQAGSIVAAMLQDGATLSEILDDDGTGSGLDADYFDGYSSNDFTRISQDYGRSGVSSTLYEGTTSLTSKYVNEGQASSITGSMIVSSTITSSDLAANSVYASEIATSAVGSLEIAANAVGASEIATNAVGSLEIAANAVGASEIAFSLDYTGSDLNGGLVSMVNTAGGTAGNFPAALYGGANGTPGSYKVFGVLGLVPALGTANSAISLIPDAAIGMAGASQDGYGVVGTSTSHYHAAIYGESTAGYGIYGKHTDSSLTSPAVYGKNEGSGIGVLGDAYNGTSAGVLGRTYSSTGVGVRGQASVSSNYGELGKAGIGVEAQGSTYSGKFVGDIGVYSGSTEVARYDVSDYSLHMFNAAGDMTIEIDSDFTGDGRIITDELQITGGSDLSEHFDVDRHLSPVPGMLVSIDPLNPGKLQVSHEAYDRKVAGIISGAGGIKTGMMMGQAGSIADGDMPVALTGRVYCMADASQGAIEPGDLLTTSDVPGHAMKVADHGKATGAVIGKAMTQLKENTGLVLVLVSLQ